MCDGIADKPAMDLVRRCLDAYPADAVWLIAVLEDIQAGLGFVPAGAAGLLADRLGLRAPDVRALIEGCEAFQGTPPARHLLHVCTGPFCAAAGSHELLAAAEGELDCRAGHCLGYCDEAPVMMLDGEVYRRARRTDVPGLLQRLNDACDA